MFAHVPKARIIAEGSIMCLFLQNWINVKIRNTVRIHDILDRIRCARQDHATKSVIPAVVKTDIHSVTHLVAKER